MVTHGPTKCRTRKPRKKSRMTRSNWTNSPVRERGPSSMAWSGVALRRLDGGRSAPASPFLSRVLGTSSISFLSQISEWPNNSASLFPFFRHWHSLATLTIAGLPSLGPELPMAPPIGRNAGPQGRVAASRCGRGCRRASASHHESPVCPTPPADQYHHLALYRPPASHKDRLVRQGPSGPTPPESL